MVSAANSFRLMDGGVDYAISEYFGWDLERTVQRKIIETYGGEQPIGTSMLVETGNRAHPWIAHTPTMRVPMEIADTDNVYTAMRALLRDVSRHNAQAQTPIEIVACPGLGTRTGRVPAGSAARQIRHRVSEPVTHSPDTASCVSLVSGCSQTFQLDEPSAL